MYEDISPLDVKIAIVRKGIFQYMLAHELGISEICLSRFLRGRGNLKPETRAQLFERLDLASISAGRCNGE